MCGIGGVLLPVGRPCDEAALDRMSAAMHERGPDDHGLLADAGAGLVHRRLSILDLSEAGRCPIPNEDASVHAVLNGEIYNFAELRAELSERGHRFRSHCDSEVVVHGYEEWGEELVARLHGMFALAVWDSPRRRLLLARDRLGQKPLYVLERGGRLLFASTLNALLAHEDGRLDVDRDALECYLSHGFIPHPHTIWQGVESLPPAHLAVMEQGGELRRRAYWAFSDATRVKVGVEEAEEQVVEALERSVKARLVADVPVGGFLSGGVDSSLVMALAARHSPRVDTFSIGFEESDASELPYAKQVAEAIGSTHHELVLQEDVIYDVLPDLVWQYGQPFGDSSSIPTHLVSRMARERVKVSLSGDGGDESFAGYWRAESGVYADLFRRVVPQPLREHAVPGLVRMLAGAGQGGLAERLRALNRLSLAAPGAGYGNAESWFEHRDALLGEAMRGGGREHDVVACRTGKSFGGGNASALQQILYDDFQVLLPDAYLVKVDVASMAASLEVRCPMLDHRFVDLAWHLPDSLKLRRGSRKWLLKRVAAKFVPPSVIYRQKQGFAMPMARWWRGGLAELLARLLEESRCVDLGWIRAEPVQRALVEQRGGRVDHSTRLWLILWLELWVRGVLEGSLDRGASLRDWRG